MKKEGKISRNLFSRFFVALCVLCSLCAGDYDNVFAQTGDPPGLDEALESLLADNYPPGFEVPCHTLGFTNEESFPASVVLHRGRDLDGNRFNSPEAIEGRVTTEQYGRAYFKTIMEQNPNEIKRYYREYCQFDLDQGTDCEFKGFVRTDAKIVSEVYNEKLHGSFPFDEGRPDLIRYASELVRPFRYTEVQTIDGRPTAISKVVYETCSLAFIYNVNEDSSAAYREIYPNFPFEHSTGLVQQQGDLAMFFGYRDGLQNQAINDAFFYQVTETFIHAGASAFPILGTAITIDDCTHGRGTNSCWLEAAVSASTDIAMIGRLFRTGTVVAKTLRSTGFLREARKARLIMNGVATANIYTVGVGNITLAAMEAQKENYLSAAVNLGAAVGDTLSALVILKGVRRKFAGGRIGKVKQRADGVCDETSELNITYRRDGKPLGNPRPGRNLATGPVSIRTLRNEPQDIDITELEELAAKVRKSISSSKVSQGDLYLIDDVLQAGILQAHVTRKSGLRSILKGGNRGLRSGGDGTINSTALDDTFGTGNRKAGGMVVMFYNTDKTELPIPVEHLSEASLDGAILDIADVAGNTIATGEGVRLRNIAGIAVTERNANSQLVIKVIWTNPNYNSRLRAELAPEAFVN